MATTTPVPRFCGGPTRADDFVQEFKDVLAERQLGEAVDLIGLDAAQYAALADSDPRTATGNPSVGAEANEKRRRARVDAAAGGLWKQALRGPPSEPLTAHRQDRNLLSAMLPRFEDHHRMSTEKAIDRYTRELYSAAPDESLAPATSTSRWMNVSLSAHANLERDPAQGGHHMSYIHPRAIVERLRATHAMEEY